MACPFCQDTGGTLVFQAPLWRLVRADEAGFPAFYRLVWNAHVTEFSDLSAAERADCMEAVVQVERALREVLLPLKINLAALGNMVPHLHWHVIARFAQDSHFPSPVWAAPVRAIDPAHVAEVTARLPRVEELLAERLRQLSHGA